MKSWLKTASLKDLQIEQEFCFVKKYFAELKSNMAIKSGLIKLIPLTFFLASVRFLSVANWFIIIGGFFTMVPIALSMLSFAINEIKLTITDKKIAKIQNLIDEIEACKNAQTIFEEEIATIKENNNKNLNDFNNNQANGNIKQKTKDKNKNLNNFNQDDNNFQF